MAGMGMAQGVGGGGLGSPVALAEQQARWEKEIEESQRLAYRGQLGHAALMLLAGPDGGRFDAASALKTAHEVFQGAKGYSP